MKRSLFLIGTGVLFMALFLAAACNGAGDSSPSTTSENEATSGECQAASPADGAETILIPSGSFMMGSPESNEDAEPDEFPEHEASLSCYSIYKEEVTNGMYADCVAAGACLPITPVAGTPSEFAGDEAQASYPAVGVNYNMASDYCEWAGGRLPSEAEWEYAASGGEAIIFPWGNEDADCDKANFLGCLDPAASIAVGSLPDGASPPGVEDMAGNAWEWVFDWYGYDAYASPSLTGPSSGSSKVVRGGGYNSDLQMLTASNRHAGNPYFAYSDVGFRCVLTEALDLPEEYQQTFSGLYEIPFGSASVDAYMPPEINPGSASGESAKKYTTFSDPGCPDGSGNYHFPVSVYGFGEVTNPRIRDYNVLPATWYPCGLYDPVTHLMDCPLPAQSTSDTTIEVGVNFTSSSIGEIGIGAELSLPTDCGGLQSPTNFSIISFCGNDGIVPVTLTFEPAITWYEIETMSHEPMDCVVGGPNEVTCFVDEMTHDGLYKFVMHGTYNGEEYFWVPHFMVFVSCAAGQEEPLVFIFSACEPGPMLGLNQYYFLEDTVLGPVSAGEKELTCAETKPSTTLCALDPPLEEGDFFDATICLDGTCEIHPFMVPNCSEVQDHGTYAFVSCAGSEPSIKIDFLPSSPSEIVSITANGVELICSFSDPDSIPCSGLPGEPGDQLAIQINYPYGVSEQPFTVTYPECAVNGGLTITNRIGCETDGEYSYRTSVSPVQDITSVQTGGETMACDLSVEGAALCRNITRDPVDEVALATYVCYEDGHCASYNVAYPDCGPAGGACGCTFIGSGCLSEYSMYFSADICSEDPKPLEPGSTYAMDAVGNQFACDLLPSVDGRVYCSGARPNMVMGGLSLFYKFAGDGESRSCSWDATAWNDALPWCQVAEQPEEPAQPGQPAAVDCSIYTWNTCGSAGCFWHKTGTMWMEGYCSSTP